MYKDYIVVEADTTRALANKVNLKINQGYTPLGSLVVTEYPRYGTSFIQPMAKPDGMPHVVAHNMVADTGPR